jgi:hypothetical protein
MESFNMKKYQFDINASDLKSELNNYIQDNLYVASYNIGVANHDNERSCTIGWFDNTPKSSRWTVTRILRRRGFNVVVNRKRKEYTISW